MIIPDEIINKQLGKIVVYNLRHSWLTTITHLPHSRTVINYNAYYFPSKQNKNKKSNYAMPSIGFFSYYYLCFLGTSRWRITICFNVMSYWYYAGVNRDLCLHYFFISPSVIQ
jgi:hypothetical protein